MNFNARSWFYQLIYSFIFMAWQRVTVTATSHLELANQTLDVATASHSILATDAIAVHLDIMTSLTADVCIIKNLSNSLQVTTLFTFTIFDLRSFVLDNSRIFVVVFALQGRRWKS